MVYRGINYGFDMPLTWLRHGLGRHKSRLKITTS